MMTEDKLQLLHHKQITLFACDVARLVLPIWENEYPKDKRPRLAIETSELFFFRKATKSQVKEAENAAWAASGSLFSSNAEVHAANAAANAAWTAWTSSEDFSLHSTMRVIGNVLQANVNAFSSIQHLYQQALPVTIPITPTLQSIAENIITTRNFEEYYVLLDNLEEVHNITLPREVPLGLSHYVLFYLTNTH